MTIIKFIKTLMPAQFLLFYVFFMTGLVVNFLQLLTLLIWPFNIKLYRKLNIWLAYSFWTNMTSLASYWSGSTVDLYMNEEDFKYIGKEHAIIIMNHKYDIDWLMGWVICQRVGMLAGSKIIGKSTLSLIPLIGWCWLFTESIFIKRQWETDKKKLVEGMDKILNNYPDNYYFNVLIYCEGTRFTKSKHEESMKVAREKGFPELKHHILPRTKGFSLLAKGASGRINAVYDLTLGIEEKDGIRPDLNGMRNGIPFKGELVVKRIPMSEVPQDDAGSAEFIHNLYRKKDELFDVYHKNGTFKSLNISQINKPPNYYDLYLHVMWAILLCTPMLYYLFYIIQNGTLYSNIVLCLVLVGASVSSKLFIGFSSSEKGSKYGQAVDKKKE